MISDEVYIIITYTSSLHKLGSMKKYQKKKKVKKTNPKK